MIDEIIDNINPQVLDSINYPNYINQIYASIQGCLNGSQLLLLIQAIKGLKPCFKRDILIEVISRLVYSNDSCMSDILCESNKSWKLLANTIASLPDIVANSPKSFKPDTFYPTLLDQIYHALGKHYTNCQKGQVITIEQKLLLIQLIGRIALCHRGETIWLRLFSRALNDDRSELIELVSEIITLPLSCDTQICYPLEIFIEPICMTIFLHMQPSRTSGSSIRCLLKEHILNNETVEYVICNKLIMQRNLQLNRKFQRKFLFNIFSYLSSIGQMDQSSSSSVVHNHDSSSSSTSSFSRNEPSLLCKTFLNLLENWSNSTKILLRPHEHSCSISLAMTIAFRYLLESGDQSIRDNCGISQEKLMRGVQIYLDRSSMEQRSVALCCAEIMMQKLHKLSTITSQSSFPELNLDYELTEECHEMRDSFTNDVDKIFFSDPTADNDNDRSATIAEQFYENENENEKKNKNNDSSSSPKASKSNIDDKIKQSRKSGQKPPPTSVETKYIGLNKPKSCSVSIVSEIEDEDDDDLSAIEPEDQDDEDSDLLDDIGNIGDGGDVVSSAPIYLRDCIEGLAQNDKPRYVKLCLIKAGELVREHALRDVAIELAQLLLYLEDSFNIDNFQSYRIGTLASLCIAEPELVGKFLLDEFNHGTRRNFRHQLDILQVLVASAQQISNLDLGKEFNLADDNSLSAAAAAAAANNKARPVAGSQTTPKSSVNQFRHYAALYFYGICNRLKSHESPLCVLMALRDDEVVDASKSEDYFDDGTSLLRAIPNQQHPKLDNSYLLSRIFFSLSLIIRCVQQQPITCKLSRDLLDIIAAYRRHPDFGVRKALAACLAVIRDCTPKVYLEQHLSHQFEQATTNIII